MLGAGFGVRFVIRFAHNNLLPELACRKATWLRFSNPDGKRAGAFLPAQNKTPFGVFILCLGPGSNRRPLPLQGSALPTELPKRRSMLSQKEPLNKAKTLKLLHHRVKCLEPRQFPYSETKLLVRASKGLKIGLKDVKVDCEW